MLKHLLQICLLISLLLLASCENHKPVFDEDAWYSRRANNTDPQIWAVGKWVYGYWSQPEELTLSSDKTYKWIRRPKDYPVQTDSGTWSTEGGSIFLMSSNEARTAGPPPELIRVPTASGDMLVPTMILNRWRQQGFQPGDVPRGGRAFRYLPE